MFERERERAGALNIWPSFFVCLNMNKKGAVTFTSSFSKYLLYLPAWQINIHLWSSF